MTTTPTPRTNSKVVLCNYGELRVSADFARQLERELTEAKAERDRLRAVAKELAEALEVAVLCATIVNNGSMNQEVPEWKEALARYHAAVAEDAK